MTRRAVAIVVIAAAAVAVVVGLLARAGKLPNPFGPLDLAAKPGLLTEAQLFVMGNDTAACIAAMQRVGVTVQPMPARSDRPGCDRIGTVTIARFSQASIEPEEMRCEMALRLYLLERHDIQPLAQRHFGKAVDRLYDFGSYSCRNKRGGWTLSEHATANAYDLAGVRLAGGRVVNLKSGWTGDPATAGFLHALRDRACTLFSMVLSPDYNADHADHLHFDMGLWQGCH
jgi:hypothetical protein